jgi:hypothetical protein
MTLWQPMTAIALLNLENDPHIVADTLLTADFSGSSRPLAGMVAPLPVQDRVDAAEPHDLPQGRLWLAGRLDDDRCESHGMGFPVRISRSSCSSRCQSGERSDAMPAMVPGPGRAFSEM